MTERAQRYLSAREAARYLGISKASFFTHVRKHVAAIKLGKRATFDVVDLDAFAATKKEAPATESAPRVAATIAASPRAAPIRADGRKYVLDADGRLRRRKD